MQVLACPVRLSGTAGRRRVFSPRRRPISKRREDATRFRWRRATEDGLGADHRW